MDDSFDDEDLAGESEVQQPGQGLILAALAPVGSKIPEKPLSPIRVTGLQNCDQAIQEILATRLQGKREGTTVAQVQFATPKGVSELTVEYFSSYLSRSYPDSGYNPNMCLLSWNIEGADTAPHPRERYQEDGVSRECDHYVFYRGELSSAVLLDFAMKAMAHRVAEGPSRLERGYAIVGADAARPWAGNLEVQRARDELSYGTLEQRQQIQDQKIRQTGQSLFEF